MIACGVLGLHGINEYRNATKWVPSCLEPEHPCIFPWSGKLILILWRVLFSFLPLCWPPLFLPLSRHLQSTFSPSKSALFCRAKGTAPSLERGSLRMDLSKDFGKEIPSRNLRKKRSGKLILILSCCLVSAPKSQRLLRLRCPSRNPDIASDFGDKIKQCAIAI